MSEKTKIGHNDFSVELLKSPRKYNRSLRISGVQSITPDVIRSVEGICGLLAENEPDKDKKSDWERMQSNAEKVIKHNLCPEEGVSVLGPFMIDSVRFPEKGDQVVIKSGAVTRSTHPDPQQAEKTLKRAQTVTVHQVYGGYIDVDKTISVKDPEVHWAGTGGYWRWTLLNNVE